MWKQLIIISIIGLIMASNVLAFTPQQMADYVVGGMKEEGITVKCSITLTKGEDGYNYHVTHVKGFTAEEDFLFACMGTIAVNSALADFSTNWLYMTYNNSTSRIEVALCQKIWLESEKPDISPEDVLKLMDKMRAALEKVK